MLPKGFYAFHPLHDTESHQIAVLFTLRNREPPDPEVRQLCRYTRQPAVR